MFFTILYIILLSFLPDINKAPVAHAGPDVVVHLPNRAAELDGSKSSDDHGIATYLWLRDPKSPAAGVCLSVRLSVLSNMSVLLMHVVILSRMLLIRVIIKPS